MDCTCSHRRSSSSSSAPLAGAAARPPPPIHIAVDIDKLVFQNRAHKLESIENSIEHRLTLRDWTAQLEACSNNVGRKLSSRNSSTSDLYQILGLFCVFEGVVITAVAQASAIRCHNSWYIFALSCIATAATFGGCVQKLREIREGERIYLGEKALCSSLHSSIELLKERGAEFDLTKDQPNMRWDIRMDHRADESSGFWGTWVWSYEGAVLLVLLLFSGVTLATVRALVCDPRSH